MLNLYTFVIRQSSLIRHLRHVWYTFTVALFEEVAADTLERDQSLSQSLDLCFDCWSGRVCGSTRSRSGRGTK